jgi:hypothetical protein
VLTLGWRGHGRRRDRTVGTARDPIAGLTRLATRALAVTVLVLGVVYAGDSLWVRSRRGGTSGDGVLGSVTFYVVVPLKNGKTEIYSDQPQTEVCIRALLPHQGYRPCWYAARDRFHPG